MWYISARPGRTDSVIAAMPPIVNAAKNAAPGIPASAAGNGGVNAAGANAEVSFADDLRGAVQKLIVAHSLIPPGIVYSLVKLVAAPEPAHERLNMACGMLLQYGVAGVDTPDAIVEVWKKHDQAAYFKFLSAEYSKLKKRCRDSDERCKSLDERCKQLEARLAMIEAGGGAAVGRPVNAAPGSSGGAGAVPITAGGGGQGVGAGEITDSQATVPILEDGHSECPDSYGGEDSYQDAQRDFDLEQEKRGKRARR